MGIKTETFFVGENEFTRTYSDAGRYVVCDGVEYDEACDLAEFGRTYVEGDLMPVSPEDIEAKAEAYDILIGEVE